MTRIAITAAELDALYKVTRERVRNLLDKVDFALTAADMAWDAEQEAKRQKSEFGRIMYLNEAARRWEQACACYSTTAHEYMECYDAANRCRHEAEELERFLNA